MALFATIIGSTALLPIVRGVAFGSPNATPVNAEPGHDARNFAPNPTPGPSIAQLGKRLILNLEADTAIWFTGCSDGYLDGGYSDGISFPKTIRFTSCSNGFPDDGYPDGSSYAKSVRKRANVALIVGAVIGVLFLLFFVGVAVIFIHKRRKKSRWLAANEQTMAATRGKRPQPTYAVPQPPVQLSVMSPPSQTPQPPATYQPFRQG